MPLLDKSAFADPTLPIPSWAGVKSAVRGLMGAVPPTGPYEEAGRTVQQSQTVPKNVLGYPIRDKLFPGEESFFKGNPSVAGMAAEDMSIILNPYSNLKDTERDAVAFNEAIRLHMRSGNIVPNISVTPDQDKFFKGTKYESANDEKKQTIIARILSGDPSVTPTKEQQAEAQRILSIIQYGAK